MINVNQITSELAKMPDAALKQYATMHKNDPYTLSLAMSESNRRQQLRQGVQGQGGQQPTVVDQELAQMGAPTQPQAMPENVGIGTLPQQPMSMAEGGIVAFAGEGPSRVVDPHAEQDVYSPDGVLISGPSLGRGRPEDTTLLEMFGIRNRENRLALEKIGAPTAVPRVNDASRSPDTEVGLPPAAAAAPNPLADLKAKQDALNAPSANTRMATTTLAAPAAPVAAFDSAAKRKELMDGIVPVDRFAAQRKADTATSMAEETAAMERRKEENTAENATMFKGQEDRINKREGELTKSKNTNSGMAFLQAGLAMMQARGPGLAAIAQGAGVGLKQYGEGIDKIKSAQEKLDEARDRIDTLRLNKSSMDKKEIQGMETGIRALAAGGRKDLQTGIEKAFGDAAAGVTADVQNAVVANEGNLTRASQMQIHKLDAVSREKIAGMPGDQQRMLTTLGGSGGLAAGLAKMQEIQADKTGAAYAKMFTEARTDAIKAGAEPPTATAFAASLRQLAMALNPARVPDAVSVGANTRQ